MSKTTETYTYNLKYTVEEESKNKFVVRSESGLNLFQVHKRKVKGHISAHDDNAFEVMDQLFFFIGGAIDYGLEQKIANTIETSLDCLF